jgi:hypothetical protein
MADGTLVVAGAAVGTATSSLTRSACADGSQKKDGYRWHHLATNKNETAGVREGPWTPLFEALFARAGMGLEDPTNLVYLARIARDVCTPGAPLHRLVTKLDE